MHACHSLAPDTSPFSCLRSKRVDRCFFIFVDEEFLGAIDLTSYVGTIPTWLASYFLFCDLPLLFVYSQANNGVWVMFEDIYTIFLSVLVSILDQALAHLNDMYLSPLLTVL